MSLQSRLNEIGKKQVYRLKNGNAFGYSLENPKDLPEETRALIFNKFYAVALSGFGKNDTPDFQKDVNKHLIEAKDLILVFNDEFSDLGIGFMAHSSHCMCLNGGSVKILYINGVAVASPHHSRGICQTITSNLAISHDFVTARTQNPAIVNSLVRLYGKVYPVTAEPTTEVKRVAQHMAKAMNMGDNYNSELMIQKGTYGGVLTGSLPTVKDDTGKRVFGMINLEAGDSIIVVSHC